MTVLFSDNFNRADGSPGANWTSRGTADVWTIASNKLTISGAAGGFYIDHIAAANVTTADYQTSCILNDTTNYEQVGLVARRVDYSTDDSDCYTAFLITNTALLYCYKKIAGSYTQLGSSYNTGFSASTDYPIVLQTNGSAISVDWNGTTSVISATDTSLTASGDAGVIAFDSGQSSTFLWDDFSVDDYTAGGTVIPVNMSGGMQQLNGGLNG